MLVTLQISRLVGVGREISGDRLSLYLGLSKYPLSAIDSFYETEKDPIVARRIEIVVVDVGCTVEAMLA